MIRAQLLHGLRRKRRLQIAGVVPFAGLALIVAGAAPAREAPVVAGVTTHFAQGWPERLLPVARALGAGMIRDAVAWPAVEKTPGAFAFTPANSAHVDRACAAGLKVLLMVEPRNPLYDAGQTAHSPTALAAYARYARALADRWPHCVAALEIGNEINGKGGMTGPAAANRIASHIALLRAVHDAVKPAHPDLALLGGSTNGVPVGFLRQLFGPGALGLVDGVAVHPYRRHPEGVEQDMGRLSAAMRAAGTVRPIWATEFSRDFARPEDAAPFYLKMIALMEGAGVRHHLWYALADQRGFPTMGLARFDGSEKPAGRAFRFAAARLRPLGPARRIDHGDPALYDYGFGETVRVIWGAPRGFTAVAAGPDSVRALAADGSPIPVPSAVSDTPVVLVGVRDLRLAYPRVLADSLYGFSQPPLAWFARRIGTPAGPRLLPLVMRDWQWDGYLGAAGLSGAAVTPMGTAVAPGTATLIRWRAPAPATVYASACLAARAPEGGNLRAAIEHNGTPRWAGPTGGSSTAALARVAVAAGDTLDLVIANPGNPTAQVRYRWRIATTPADPAPCPLEPTP